MLRKIISVVFTLAIIFTLLIASIFIIKIFGLWSENNALRLLLTLSVGFVTYYLLFSYLLKIFSPEIRSLISMKSLYWAHFTTGFIFIFLTAFTAFLMDRQSTYSEKEIVDAVTVFASIAIYSFGCILASRLGHKSLSTDGTASTVTN